MQRTIVEVQLVDLNLVRADAWTVLDEAERARAARFHRPQDAQRWIASRAALRVELGAALAMPPSSLTFRYGAQGKPELAGEVAGRLAFNVSHSGHLAAIAWIRAAADGPPPPVGVDVEEIRPIAELEELVARTFAPVERESWHAVAIEDRLTAFHRIWTRKEAILKALGLGIGAPLHAVVVHDVSSPVVPLESETGMAGGAWTLLDLDPAPGVAGALAVRAPDVQLRVRVSGAPIHAGTEGAHAA